MTIPKDRLLAAVERRDYYSPADGPVLSAKLSAAHNDAADLAARLLKLEPLWEKAMEVLRETEGSVTIHGTPGYCQKCLGAVLPEAVRAEEGCKDPHIGHDRECEYAELLKDD